MVQKRLLPFVVAITAAGPSISQESTPPAQALAARVARYCGGLEALRKLQNLSFRETATSKRRGVVSNNVTRWEIVGEKPERQPPARATRGTPYEIMVLHTKTRKNLLTVPEPRQRRASRGHLDAQDTSPRGPLKAT